jgi:hypothetical protein
MNVNNLVQKAKITLNQANAYVKEKIYEVTGTPSATVSELAEFITGHKDTIVTTKKYLGLTFFFYRLDLMGIRYYLERKNSGILQLDANTMDHTIVSYRSYRDKLTLDTPIKFP